MVAGHKAGGPAKLQAIAAGRAINIKDVADEVEIGKETRAHRSEINLIK